MIIFLMFYYQFYILLIKIFETKRIKFLFYFEIKTKKIRPIRGSNPWP